MVELKEILKYIDPSALDYEEWLEIGMGLKHAADNGESVTWLDWDEWSKPDTRYQKGVCHAKWNSFNSSGITQNTIIARAIQNGYDPLKNREEFDWDDEIELDKRPETDDFVRFLKAVFKPDDLVSFVTKSNKDKEKGKYYPADSGTYGVPAKKLIKSFNQRNVVEDAIGNYNLNAGVWIRFNPMDGEGVKNTNVLKYRYTLVESDETSISDQLELITKLRLPCVALTYSGGKSIHALVKVNAENLEEYKQRVEFIYKNLEKKGFKVDRNNKNPARLTRLPGVFRGEEKQKLLFTNIGYSDFETWQEYVENNFQEIELPEIENFEEVSKNLPPLAPELIEGVLREGHKMLIAGSSKAGKSFSLIELGIALAEGIHWMGFQCRQSKVLYINLEIDQASFKHRVNNVYEQLDLEEEHRYNFDMWNLRGLAQPMRKLTPKLIKRVRSKNYNVIILDPVYKVQSGDENAAGDIAAFTNEFDRITTELGCSMVYCHHHSKGNQGGKRSVDRASGSGVFARDPDAIIDMIELENDTYKENEFYKNLTAWRIEGTLREFPPFKPVNVFFNFPIHELDTTGLLDEAEVKDYSVKPQRRKRTLEEKQSDFELAFEIVSYGEDECQEEDLRKYYGGISSETLRRRIWEYNKNSKDYSFKRKKGTILRIPKT